MTPSSRISALHPSGMTLIEAIGVILLLVMVISVVFTKSRALRTTSDRTACLNNIGNMQLVVRAFQRLHELPDRTPINIHYQFVGLNKSITTEPFCPSTGNYTYATAIPIQGDLAMSCSLSKKSEHQPENYQNW